LNSEKGEHLLREPLYILEAKLDPGKFSRIHRSAIVNVDYIKEIRPSDSGDHSIILIDGKKLTLTRKYRDKLLDHF
jgi:two-component system LytT family response regulator